MTASASRLGWRYLATRRGLAAACATLLLSGQSVLAQGQFEAATTPSGISFHHREQSDTPFAAITFGMRDVFALTTEGKEGFNGLGAAFVLQSARGEGQDDLSEQLKDLAATATISFGPFSTVGTVRAPAANIAASMGLMTSALKTAQPDDKLLQRLKQRASGADAQAALRVETIAQQTALYFALGKHPLTRGFEAGRFGRVSASDLAAWRKATLARSRLNISISGRISKAEAARIVDEAFADLQAEAPQAAFDWPAVEVQRGIIVVERDTPQSAILLVGLTTLTSPSDVETATVANGVLGGSNGRLWQGVRAALGSTYGAGSALQLVGPGKRIVTLRTAVDNDKVEATLAALKSVYTTWREKGVSASELKAVTSRLVNEQRSALDDPARANGLVVAMRLAGRPVEDVHTYDKRLRGLDQVQLNRFIVEKFPATERLFTVIVTPRASGLGATCTIRSAEEALRCRK
jgi:predicted Zn-dependent peptidase